MLRTNPGLREVSPSGNSSAARGFRDIEPIEFSPVVPESRILVHGLPPNVDGFPTTLPGFVTIVREFPTHRSRIPEPSFAVSDPPFKESQNRRRSPKPSGVPCAYLVEVTSLSPGLPPQRLPWVTAPQPRPVPCKGSFPLPVTADRSATMIDGPRKQSLQDRVVCWGPPPGVGAAHQPRAEGSIPYGESFGRGEFWKHGRSLWEASLRGPRSFDRWRRWASPVGLGTPTHDC